MNVCCFSIINFWQGSRGGMDLHCKMISEGLVENGDSVSIISSQHPENITFQRKNGVDIYNLDKTVFSARRGRWPKDSVSKFLVLHQDRPFDVIWSQSFDGFGLPASIRAMPLLPVVLTLHGSIAQEIISFKNMVISGSANYKKIFKSFAGLIYSYFIVQKPMLAMSRKIVAVSDAVFNDLIKFYGKSIADKCTVISNGVDTGFFKPNLEHRYITREKIGISKNEPTLLSLGAFEYEKGHHIALKAIELLKKEGFFCKLILVGDGNRRAELEKMVAAKKLDREIVFIGKIKHHDTVKFYNAADIFLMPTLRIEGLPFVLLEAMACGKPVIASKIGGNLSVIRDGHNGIFIEPGNSQQLAMKIKSLFMNKQMFDSISFFGRKCVEEKYSKENMINKTIATIHSAI